MNISERIKERRKSLGLTLQDIGDEIGVAKATIQRYESGDIQNVGLDKIANLASALKVSPGWLLGWEESSTAQAPPISRSDSSRKVPLLGTIRAGRTIPVAEDYEGYIDIDHICNADFALRVTGDSMSWAGIHTGDIALITANTNPSNGDIVAAGLADGDWSATLKYFVANNGTPRLRAGNPEYDDIPLKEGWAIAGTVTHIIKEAPGLSEYQELLGMKEHRDDGWAKVIAAASEHGVNSEKLYHLVLAMSPLLK